MCELRVPKRMTQLVAFLYDVQKLIDELLRKRITSVLRATDKIRLELLDAKPPLKHMFEVLVRCIDKISVTRW